MSKSDARLGEKGSRYRWGFLQPESGVNLLLSSSANSSECRLGMRENKVRVALKVGKPAVGTMITEFRTPEIARILASSGFDFVFIDTEHAAFDLETVTDIIRAGRAVGLVCMVRVPDAEYHLIARALDIGAEGLLVPRVESRQQVESIVRWAKYPPLGVRGFGVRGIISDYRKAAVKEWIQELNENTMVVIQIEKKRAIESIDDLVSVDGVDAALIGPYDLSISLGVPGEFDSSVFNEAIQKVVDACKRHGVASGTHVRDMESLLFWRDRGMRLLTYSSDVGLIMSSASDAVSTIKAFSKL